MIKKHVARQLAKPSGFIGRFLLAPLWNRRNALLNDRTLAALRLRENDRVLDIGFGGGYLLAQMLKGIHNGYLAGVDASPVIVSRANTKWSIYEVCFLIRESFASPRGTILFSFVATWREAIFICTVFAARLYQSFCRRAGFEHRFTIGTVR